MTLDEEILAEERLSESQELILYNMSLRQTSQRAAGGREGTHVLLSRIEDNPAYQQMIERGLLECQSYGRGGTGSSAAATLIVTRKGLRYCALFSEEIEPRRAYDVGGVRRGADRDGQIDPSDEFNYAVITSGIASGSSAAKDAAVALSKEQVAQFEEIGAQRRNRPPASPMSLSGVNPSSEDDNPVVIAITPDMTFSGFSVDKATIALSKDQVEQFGEISARRKSMRRIEREFKIGNVSGKREHVSESGDVWTYVVADESVVQIIGVSGSSRVLHIPGEIEGHKVIAIAANALSANDSVEEIVCPDSVESIGEGAFRLNTNLRRLVLPAQVPEFKASWISRCPNLKELVLPDMVDEISRGMFECKGLSKLVVGKGVRAIEPGAFCDTCLSEATIDQANPFIATDGTAIYTKDGAEMLALVRPVRSLAVSPGCKRLAKKCCFGFAQLEEVEVPDSLVEIGPFAFSYSNVGRFDAPPSLKVIGDKAFFGCRSLRSVSLNDGLETIGDSAFEGSAISALSIPASITKLGKSMTRGTGIVHSGPDCTLTIKAGCEDLLLNDGGLYRKREDGFHMVQLIDGSVETYEVMQGTVAIDPYAFAYNDCIITVRVPDSVRSIGRSSFRICKNLRHVELPDTVRSIGDEAFFDTSLEEFRVPAQLHELGSRALVTYGAHHGNKIPSLTRIEVAPGNESFYETCGMLCRKTDAGASVVVFSSSTTRVTFPNEVTHVEEYAFNNARGIEYLALNPRLSTIGTNGLSTRCWIRQIHIELAKPVEGRLVYDFFFPDTPGAVRGISLGLGGASWVNVRGIIEQLDICLTSAHDYNVQRKSGDISAYAQARLILDRLDDPVMLTHANRLMMERVLRNNVEEICVDVALHDDRAVLEDLIDRGFLDASSLERVIERVGALRDAATSAYLLEAKHQKFAHFAFDYDL